jgi:hypothetical protein
MTTTILLERSLYRGEFSKAEAMSAELQALAASNRLDMNVFVDSRQRYVQLLIAKGFLPEVSKL